MLSCVKNLPEVSIVGHRCHKSIGPGLLTGGASSGAGFTLVTGSEVPLPNNAVISDVEILAACTRDAIYKIELLDNVTPIKIASHVITNTNHPTLCCKLDCEEFTTGKSGVQTLRVLAHNITNTSNIHASLRAMEEL